MDLFFMVEIISKTLPLKKITKLFQTTNLAVCVKNAHFIPKTATLRDAFQYVRVKPLQCPTVCDPMDCTVHGILQARILKRGAFPFSRGYSQPRDWTQVSRIAGGFYTSWATKEAPFYIGKAVLKKYLKSM